VSRLTAEKHAAAAEVQRLKVANELLDSENRDLQTTNLVLTEDHQQLGAAYQNLDTASEAMATQIKSLTLQLADAKLASQTAQASNGASKGVSRLSAKQLAEELDDMVSCEICVGKMWSPWMYVSPTQLPQLLGTYFSCHPFR
jgi:hypothetical protein